MDLDTEGVDSMPSQLTSETLEPQEVKLPSPVIRPRRTASLPVNLRSSSSSPEPQSCDSPSNPTSRHPYAKKLAPLATSNINTMYAQQAIRQAVASSSSSKSLHSIISEEEEASPVSPISPILAPKGNAPMSPAVKLRAGGSRAAPLFKSSHSRLQSTDKAASTRSLSDASSSVSHERSPTSPNSILVHRSTHSVSTLSSDAPKSVRAYGRGGAGRKLRPTKRESSVVDISPMTSPSSPPSSFVRPMGRGGLGSRPKNATKAGSPKESKKAETSLIELLNVRKSKKKQKGKEKSADTSAPDLPEQTLFDLSDDRILNETRLQPSRVFRGVAGDSESDFYSPPASATSATFEAAYEEYELRKHAQPTAAQRDRKASKLARTLGDVPAGLLGALTRGHTTADARLKHRLSASLDPASAAMMAGYSPHRSASSLAKYSFDGSEADMYSFRSCSPVMFAPASPVRPVPPSLPPSPGLHSFFPPCDTFPPPNLQHEDVPPPVPPKTPPPCATSPTEVSDHPIRTTPNAQSSDGDEYNSPPLRTLVIPEVVIIPGSRPSSSAGPKRSSMLKIHSQPHSASNTHLAPPPNTPTNAAFPSDATDFLVEFAMPASPIQMDHDAILVSGRARDKAISWSGEWNVDMKDVIHALRELR